MKAFANQQNKQVESNRKEYGVNYDSIQWLNYYEAMEFEDKRNEIISQLGDRVNWGFNNTKTDVSRLSPGCKLCGEGQWSCLFINGKCNCNCFYCPAPQTEIGSPVTQTLTFKSPEPYIDYIKNFKFKGISFSGGEPFLTYDKVVAFLKSIRQQLPPDIYVWMYTNGTRTSIDQLKELADLGLNELRVDIGATNYNIKTAKEAIGIIPNVTVEIPAVPDEIEKIKSSITELADAGLSFLNLHQLRLTPYNFNNLTARNYKFSHGARVTSPESEMAALEILKYTLDNHIDLPVNYCSYAFKSRFQTSGLRKKLASKVISQTEEITHNGYIRAMSIDYSKHTSDLESLISSHPNEKYNIDTNSDRFYFHSDLMIEIQSFAECIYLTYTDIRFNNTISDIDIENRNFKVETGVVARNIKLSASEFSIFQLMRTNLRPDEVDRSDRLLSIFNYESIENGLLTIY